MLPCLERMVSILYPEGHGVQPEVEFGKPDVLKVLTAAMKTAVQDKACNPEFAFLTRADLGLFSLLHRLGARVKVRQVWERVDVR